MDPPKIPASPQVTPKTGRRESIVPDDPERTLSCLEEMLGELSTQNPDARHRTNESEKQAQKFDMTFMDFQHEGTPTELRCFDERDFQSHRREDFPQTHQPLRPILQRASVRNKKLSIIHSVPVAIDDGQNTAQNMPTSASETIPSDYQDLIDTGLKKVQFEVGGTPFSMESPGMDKKTFREPVVEDPGERIRRGDLRDPAEIPLIPTETETDPDLRDVDKDELSSHRFDNSKGFRRHKHAAKGGPGLDEEILVPLKSSKYDHQPHEIFVELDILSGFGEKREWKEAARWIKYEEDLEEGADRWGKPHVASLSFHSLINLRRLLETGVVLLDLEERDLPGVAYRVVDQMGINELILNEEKGLVLRSLLLKHKHVNESGRVWNLALKRSPGSNSSLQTVFDDRSQRKGLTTVQSAEGGIAQQNRSFRKAPGSGLMHQNSLPARMYSQVPSGRDKESGSLKRRNSGSSTHSHLELDMTKITPGLSQEDLKWIEKESTLMRQIPSNSEATIVLVGNDESLRGITIAFVRLAESVYMPNITEVPIPVRFLFILMGPTTSDLDYKEVGRSISTLMSNHQFHSIAYQAEDRRDLLKGINDFLDSCIVLPHGDWDLDLIPVQDLKEKNRATKRRKLQSIKRQISSEQPPLQPPRPPHKNPFKRTRKLFGGLVNDLKNRYRLYLSDIIDGLNFQCIATIIFLYFACISGAIAFGDLLKIKTHDYIGIPESLLGTSIGGIMYSLLSAQPLVVVGSTGPTLVFDDSLFKFCRGNGIDGREILAIRSWIGFWLSVIGFIVACFEGSVCVRFFTRFTQEVMSVLISFVFIYESFLSLIKIYREHPLLPAYNSTISNSEPDSDGIFEDPTPNIALFSTILMLGTFYIANFFRQFKNGVYLTKAMRKALGNFGVLIAIVVMSLIDGFILHPDTHKLSIPDISDGLKNTDPSKRKWFVDPLQLPILWIYASAIPAFLLYILIFLENSIAGLIVGKRELRLIKGSGFHLDVMVLCLINTVMGIWGLPWVSSAIVRAVSHVVALTVYSTNNPPGEKPIIIGVKEQRVTTLVVSVLLGLSVLMGPLLEYIPMPVLFGVFLYMGISSMAGIQFLQRVKLVFKQAENYPEVPYVRKVRKWKMHIYTLIQCIFLICLWAIKESPAALCLPFAIILLIPTRYFLLPRFFNLKELKALDSKGGDDEEEKKENSQEETTEIVLNEKEKMKQNGTTTANGISEDLSDLRIGQNSTNENSDQRSFRSI